MTSTRSARVPRPTKDTSLQNQANTEKQSLGPLVLLHVAMLQPTQAEYPDAILSKVLPRKVLNQYKATQATLFQKVGPVVRQRGILLRHPKGNFDGLLESILSTLGLETHTDVSSDDEHYGRSLGEPDELDGQQCNGTGEPRNSEDWDSADSDDTACETYCPTPELSRKSGQTQRTCSTCGRPRRRLRIQDSSHGNRYDVKVFAANGLVGPHVWEAVWREMERVDVEINVALPERWQRKLNQAVRELDMQTEDEEFENEILAKNDTIGKKEAAITEELDVQDELGKIRKRPSEYNTANDETSKTPTPGEMQKLSSKMQLNESATREEIEPKTPSIPRSTQKENINERSVSCEKLFQMFEDPSQKTKKPKLRNQIPLSILIRNCVWLLAQDARNVIIFVLVLSAIVFCSSRNTNSSDSVTIKEGQLPESTLVSQVEGATVLSLGVAEESIKSMEEEMTKTLLATAPAVSEFLPLSSALPEQQLTAKSPEPTVAENASTSISVYLPRELPEPPELPEP